MKTTGSDVDACFRGQIAVAASPFLQMQHDLRRQPAGVTPQQAQKVRVIQGALEGSNVRGVVEMARMIDVTRTYTAIAGLLQQHTDLRRNAIDKLAEVPA